MRGHLEARCWTKHPELKPTRSTTQAPRNNSSYQIDASGKQVVFDNSGDQSNRSNDNPPWRDDNRNSRGNCRGRGRGRNSRQNSRSSDNNNNDNNRNRSYDPLNRYNNNNYQPAGTHPNNAPIISNVRAPDQRAIQDGRLDRELLAICHTAWTNGNVPVQNPNINSCEIVDPPQSSNTTNSSTSGIPTNNRNQARTRPF